MGYIPIILAILGFILLWGIVNFNSIKHKKKEAEEAASLLFKYAALRNTILRQMNQVVDEDTTIHTLIEQVQPHLNDQTQQDIAVQRKIALEKEVSERIASIPPVAVDNLNYQNTYKQLQVADNHYRKAATLYQIRLKQYNDLVVKNPTRLLANVLGFKPIETL